MKLHPLSVPVRALSRALGFGWAFLIGGAALSGGNAALTGVAVLGVMVAVVAVVAYEIAYYRRFDYDLTEDSLDIASGVFSRREREIPLRRVQNVDVTRSLVARLLGLAVVDVETAGGGSTEASLRFVSREAAADLQADVRTRRTTPGDAADAATAATPDAGDADSESRSAADRAREPTPVGERGELLFALSNRDLLLYGLLSFNPRLFSGIIAVATVAAPSLGGRVAVPDLGVVVLVAGAVALALGVWLVSAAVRVVQFYGFRLRRVGGDLRYERGLFERRDGTIPLSKLQTVSVEDSVLMRRYGFASLAVETAGYAPGQSPSGGSEAAVPIAPRAAVFELAREIEPVADIDLSRPPERAQDRYVRRYALAALGVVAAGALVSRLVVSFPWYALAVLVPLAVPAARRARATRGVYSDSDHVVTQAGWWRRKTTVVPAHRVQTVLRKQTVFQRRWELTSVVIDTAGSRSLSGGGAVAIDRDGGDADALADDVVDCTLLSVGVRGDDTAAAGSAAD
ncbi:PH domain-containing protein [Halobacterium salinarum]|uniref:PH domain-containing protein n=3 Tax=Halobacterium salinarum TaxID=2242 RepID=UPI001F25E7F3|nr:PH domain-containing protein [Halobacterium salinarum]MCF2165194.1 PH domain-containing protein [Halobacterium salinarum]MCF2167997.1 PH domain-containing protein [Halobacterium salinarum]MCF2238681.1 PH domain-containing protein [Halobacterium salinarum]